MPPPTTTATTKLTSFLTETRCSGEICATLYVFQMVEECEVWLQIFMYLPTTPHAILAEVPLRQSSFPKHSKYPQLCEDFSFPQANEVFSLL